MSDNNFNPQKPLRSTSNKIKDIYDAYVKNDKTKNIPISDGEPSELNEDNTDTSTLSNESQEQTINSNIGEKVFIEMQTQIEELEKSLSESQNQVEKLYKEATEMKELSLRRTAELENFRKRSIKEKSDLIEYANENLLNNFVDILDNLSVALDSTKNAKDIESVLLGLEMIYNKTKKIFNDAGVKEMQFEQDTLFDVNLHEAMMMAPSDKPEGTIIQVIQNGYLYKDKVLRHAKVVTSSGVLD